MLKKGLLALVGIGLIILIVVVGARLLSPEDTWICQNGAWVKHGNPSGSMPTGSCKEGEQVTPQKKEQEVTIPNPASKNCTDKGGKLEMLQETAGALGICKFADGSECEEWKFFRGECQKGQTTKANTTHSYRGKISKTNNEYTFKDDTGVKYSLQLPVSATTELKSRLALEAKNGDSVIVIAAETPPLSKILLLWGFQEK